MTSLKSNECKFHDYFKDQIWKKSVDCFQLSYNLDRNAIVQYKSYNPWDINLSCPQFQVSNQKDLVETRHRIYQRWKGDNLQFHVSWRL